jgi:hypothetical protein
VTSRRAQLIETLEEHYRRGTLWGEPRREPDGTVRVEDFGGVTWIGVAVLPEDLERDDFRARLAELAEARMTGTHWRCPIELMPDPSCVGDLERLLRDLRLEDRIDVYQTAA